MEASNKLKTKSLDNPFDSLFENEEVQNFTKCHQKKKKEKEHSKMKLKLAKIQKELRIQEGELMTPSYLTKKTTLEPL